MFSLSHLIIGFFMVAFGVIAVKYTFQLANLTGSQDWLERFTGPGSTYGVYKIFGVLIAIFGLLFATGFGGGVLNFLLSPLKGIFTSLGK
jgi:hypothetical protein